MTDEVHLFVVAAAFDALLGEHRVDNVPSGAEFLGGGGARQSRFGGGEEQIGRFVRGIVEAVEAGMVKLEGIGIFVPAAQIFLRIAAQHIVGIGHHLVPIALEEVEARGEGVGGALVEVEFRVGIVVIVHQGDAAFQVGLDFVVDLAHSAAVVVDDGVLLGLLHIGDAGALRIVAVGRGPNVDEHEVEIGTEQEGLAVEGFDARRFGIARQQFECLVGLCDAFVAGIPIVEGRVEVVLVVVLPKVHGLVELRVLSVGTLGHIVRARLEKRDVGGFGIGAGEEFGDFRFGVDAHIELGIGTHVEKIVARREAGGTAKGEGEHQAPVSEANKGGGQGAEGVGRRKLRAFGAKPSRYGAKQGRFFRKHGVKIRD